MNFSAFGSPFSGFHQFSPKFEAQNTICSTFSEQDSLLNRYNMHSTASNQGINYGHNLPNYASQEHHFMSQEMKVTKNCNPKERDDAFNQQLLQQWPLGSNDYSSHLLSATLPISIQHFLKYSETIKKESVAPNGTSNINLNFDTTATAAAFGVKLEGGKANNYGGNMNSYNNTNTSINNNGTSTSIAQQQMNSNNFDNGHHNPLNNNAATNGLAGTPATTTKKKSRKKKGLALNGEVAGVGGASAKRQRKKKPPKEKKLRPKPGQIRETTALDGSKLFLCPECQMASPHRYLLEQHVIAHAVERRFVCDICHAALKRKDHLTRHKLSHVPDRPHMCNICLKSFKRKEQLTLHYIIHSGEKKHVCQECGKGFYRKDHLRKHSRSHIARRVKSEMTGSSSSNNNNPNSGSSNTTPANTSSTQQSSAGAAVTAPAAGTASSGTS